MILSAGLGSRLRPLTATLPKPLVPILNRPLLWYLIVSLRAAGIHEIVINLHYRGEQIRTWLGGGESLGVEVTYSQESELLGSAGGVRRVRGFFGDEPALIIHGDILFDVDLREVIQYHLCHNAHATVVLHPAYHRYNYGVIRVNAHGEISQFVDQRAPWVSGPLIDTVFTGVQILDPAVLDAIPGECVATLTADVYPHLLTRAWRFYGYVMQGYWSDLGTPRRYWETNMDIVSGRVTPAGIMPQDGVHRAAPHQLPWFAGNHVQPSVVLGAAAEVAGEASIGPEVILGEGCRVADGVHIVQSVLWPRVHVEAGVTIARSIITKDITIPAGSCLVDKIASASGITEL
jgi:NDP-sugar pyrophosphorylase family protein